MGQLSKENSLQREAFEIYYQMGDKRSLRAVAERVGRTERSVAGWSRTYNWVDRVSQREIEEHKNDDVTDAILAQTVASKTSYRIMINNLMRDVSRRIAREELTVKTILDFERVVKLDLLLMGEATDRQENNVSNAELSQADKDRLDTIAKLLAGK